MALSPATFLIKPKRVALPESLRRGAMLLKKEGKESTFHVFVEPTVKVTTSQRPVHMAVGTFTLFQCHTVLLSAIRPCIPAIHHACHLVLESLGAASQGLVEALSQPGLVLGQQEAVEEDMVGKLRVSMVLQPVLGLHQEEEEETEEVAVVAEVVEGVAEDVEDVDDIL